jgi:hypothetical protein
MEGGSGWTSAVPSRAARGPAFRLLAGLKHIIKLNEKKITMISIVMANEIEREQNLKSIGRKAD